MAGEWDTVFASSHAAGIGFAVTGASVARYVFDLSDWDGSRWIVPLGAHGDCESPHFADQRAQWASGELVPMRYSRDGIDAARERDHDARTASGAVGLRRDGKRAARADRLRGAVVEVGQERCVEAVHQVREPDHEAEVDDLLLGEVTEEVVVHLVGDRLVAMRRLRVADDRGLVVGIHTVGERVVAEMSDLCFVETGAPTEQHVSGNSVVAVVQQGRREIGELALCLRDLVAHA